MTRLARALMLCALACALLARATADEFDHKARPPSRASPPIDRSLRKQSRRDR
jgi:hypothetical protein